jgi:NCAIR mutase (PurE)-related protein
LRFFGHEVGLVTDVGVAGLWRLLDKVEQLRGYRVVIAVAGMEGALFSTVTGLVPGLVIAVPSSVGYGVSQGGNAALSSALASCAPGIVVVNIDNGFGAACAAQKILDPLPVRPFSHAK